MNAGLRELLGLPSINQDSATKGGEFRDKFRDGMVGLNSDLQQLAAQGNPSTHGKLATLRETLYTAYQTAAPLADPTANQRVLAAVDKTRESISGQRADTEAGREEWLKREPLFDASLVKIGELEDAGHPKAATYRAISDKVLAQANARDYQQANAVLDTLEPKLTEAYTLHVNSDNSAPGGETKKSKNDSDIGSAKTIDPKADTAQPISKSDMGNAKTPMAPLSKNDVGNAKTPIAPSRNGMGNTKSPIAPAPNNSVGSAGTPLAPTPPTPPDPTGTGDGAPRIEASTGDGQKVELKDAFNEMSNKDGHVRESGSHDFHRRIWQQYLGKTGEPPIAFRYSDEIRIDIERLTPAQHREWLELDKAKNPGRYKQPAAPPPPTVSKNAPTAGSVAGKPPVPQAKPQPKGGQVKGWFANVAEISPQLTLQRSNEGIKVHASVSPETHQSAWEDLHGKAGKAPVAYMVDNLIHVDMSRWPKDMPHPTLASGSATPSQPGPKAPTATPTAAKAPTSQVNLKQFEAEVADFARRAEAMNKAFESYERAAGKGTSAKDEGVKLKRQSDALKAEGEALVKKISASPELAGIGGKTPKEAFEIAKARGGSKGGGAFGALMQLANAYDLLQDIQYIFQADSALDGIQRTIKVGGKQAMGAAQMALITSITRSTPVAAVVTMVLGMCGDQAGACEAQEEAKRQKEEQKRLREQARQEFLAIGRFLAETVPGSVEWVEDTYYIKNKKVWDATVRRVDQMRREAYAKNKADGVKPYEIMGAEDGLAGAYPQKGKAWDSQSDFFRPEEAVDAYEKGWKQGEARRKEVLKRAKERGQRDGMEGKPINLEQLWSFPEIDELRRRDLQRRDDGFSFTDAFEPIVESYKQGHRGGQKTVTERTLQSIEMFEGKTLSGSQYTSKMVHGVAKYSMGPDVAIGSKGTWTSSDRSKVEILIQGDSVHLMMNGAGKATITVKYQDGGVTKEGSIDVTVDPVKFEVTSPNSTCEVGEELRYYAAIKNAKPSRYLPLRVSQWTAKPEGIVTISPIEPDPQFNFFDINGLVVKALKEGKVTISVTSTADKATAKTTLTVKAQKK